MPSRRHFVLGALALAAPRAWGDPAPATVQPGTWELLRRGGLVILMRHASTVEGLGDPPGFRLDDCSTQRNLSEKGRNEARRVGARFRSERVAIQHVYSSPWCRCMDTARLAFGSVEEWDPLGSFFEQPELDEENTAHVRKRIATYSRRNLHGNVAMVTHTVNIASLTKRTVRTAEIVIVRPDGCCGLRVVEQLKLV
jgi:broad specificity phosphatase PhoE